MKGHYAGREPGASEGGERVLLWAEVVKAHDASNHVVHCAGETFTPSAQGLNAAEPTVAELKEAIDQKARWERQEASRLRDEAAKAQAAAEERDKQTAEAAALAALEARGVMTRIKNAVVSALVGGSQGPEAPPQAP